METRRKRGTELLSKKRGRTLLLGKVLDGHVKSYIQDMHCHGVVVNIAVVIDCTEGILLYHDNNLLASNGSQITISKDWTKSLLHRMGYA